MRLLSRSLLSSVVSLALGYASLSCKSREAENVSATLADSSESPCHGGRILVVTSASKVLTVLGKEGESQSYPTGVFLREFTDPLIAFIRAGCNLEFVTPTGEPMTIDSNSLELLWAYYPYSSLKPEAAKHRDEAIALATTVFGRLRFSVEDSRWPRLTDEVKAYVKKIQAKQTTMSEITPGRISDVVAKLDQVVGDQAFPYVGMFVPGGHVPMEDLVRDADFGRLLNHFHKRLVPTGLICHAPVALLATKLVGPMTYKGYSVAVAERVGEQMLEQIGPLQGSRVKSYVDDDLEADGVLLVQNPRPGYPELSADRELLTGQNPASAPFLGESFLESVHFYITKGRGDGWWTGRSRYLIHPSIQVEQAKIMAKVKRVADRVVKVREQARWKEQYFLGVLGLESARSSKGGNIFINSNYLTGFDASMVATEKTAKSGLYPENASPKTVLYRVLIPILDFHIDLNPFHVVESLHNYYYVFPRSFYDYDLDKLVTSLKSLQQ